MLDPPTYPPIFGKSQAFYSKTKLVGGYMVYFPPYLIWDGWLVIMIFQGLEPPTTSTIAGATHCLKPLPQVTKRSRLEKTLHLHIEAW